MGSRDGSSRRSGRGAARLALLVVSVVGGWTGPLHAGAPIASGVREAAISAGTVEFLVVLAEQADLRAARSLLPREEQAAWVHSRLREVAEHTQRPLLDLLAARGIEHRAFWIANMVWVRGGVELLDTLSRDPRVARIEGNPTIRLARPEEAESTTVGRSIEWGLSQVGADAVWALGFDGSGVVIGGQDTGYAWDHPAIRSQYLGWDGTSADHDYHWHDAIHAGGGSCGADSPVPCDDHNHGTHTMGTMVGDDGGSNRIGMAPGARWIGCRNMDEGDGTPARYAECFQWFLAPTDLAGQNPDPSRSPHVINNSWACPPSEGCGALTLQTIVENTRAAGIVVVASAGNSGSACSSVTDPPAIYEAAFTVGATNSSDLAAFFSSRGPVTVDGSQRLKPEVAAPGVGVRSAVRGGGYSSFSGTSMAGPHVAGLVALLLSARPDLAGQVDEIETLIERAAVPLTSAQSCGGVDGGDIPNNTFGHGRIDALATLLGDADDDGSTNLADCLPLDPTAWQTPGPARELRLAGGVPTPLTWLAPEQAGAEDLRFDLLISEDPRDFSAAACLDGGLVAPASEDSASPPPGGMRAYLVRSRNACGVNLGLASSGVPRTAPACP